LIIVKRKAEILRFGLFLVLAGGLLLYVMAKSGDFQRAAAPGAVPTAVPNTAAALPGQIDLDGESYFADHRMNRDRLVAAQREEYQKLMSDDRTDAETRKLVQQRYLALAEQEARAKEAEQLIKGRGFADAVVALNEDSASVVIKGEPVSPAQFAQIVELVNRVAGIPSDKIAVWSRLK
jgi:stage III sporulation protein AH